MRLSQIASKRFLMRLPSKCISGGRRIAWRASESVEKCDVVHVNNFVYMSPGGL